MSSSGLPGSTNWNAGPGDDPSDAIVKGIENPQVTVTVQALSVWIEELVLTCKEGRGDKWKIKSMGETNAGPKLYGKSST